LSLLASTNNWKRNTLFIQHKTLSGKNCLYAILQKMWIQVKNLNNLENEKQAYSIFFIKIRLKMRKKWENLIYKNIDIHLFLDFLEGELKVRLLFTQKHQRFFFLKQKKFAFVSKFFEDFVFPSNKSVERNKNEKR
jgi:hypothetical protein